MSEADGQSARYLPIDGGWKIRIRAGQTPAAAFRVIGDCTDDPRTHRRPLYPSAERDVFFDRLPAEMVERRPFRPVVIAFNAPRFVFDFHHAGGILGHLLIGFVGPQGTSAWLHDWTELDVRYVNGRMEYDLADARFPGVRIALVAVPLADAAGALLHWRVTGATDSESLVFCYGAASGVNAYEHFDCRSFGRSPAPALSDCIDCARAGFTHTRCFGPSMAGPPDLGIPLYPDDWEAEVRGACAPCTDAGVAEIADAEELLPGPAAVTASTAWRGRDDAVPRTTGAAIQRVDLVPGAITGHATVGMGPGMAEVLDQPARAYASALARTDAIAGRVRIGTPDPFLNAAAVMMAFGLEGIWADIAYVHGGWSWRFAYLGWRIYYGPDCYGWTDRVKTAFRSHVRLSLIREGDDCGGMASTIEFPKPPIVYYNMAEGFIDQVRHFFDYTDDTALMRELFPVLCGLVEWEDRRLRSTEDALYENALNTWISDSHWYIRAQCTQASAYMLNAYTLLARLAQRLGDDPSPWRDGADRIREAMQRVLWMPRAGVFAEARDTLGTRQLHPEPELPTIYHAAEFGAADPLQITQMLHWVDTHLRVSETAHGGKQVWSSNWFPNHGRSYTHSTYELAYAETLNYALTNYLGGRADEAWELMRSTLCGLFSGPTPGGLPCHAAADGTQRSNAEFADAISMWPRAVLEGLFGIVPKKPDGLVELTPQFPTDWDDASIEAPHFAFNWTRRGGRERIEWRSPSTTRVRLKLPVRAAEILDVRVNGAAAAFGTEAGIRLTWVVVTASPAEAGSFEVGYVPFEIGQPDPGGAPATLRRAEGPTAAALSRAAAEICVRAGECLRVDVSAYGATSLLDPQGVLAGGVLNDGVLQGRVDTSTGSALVFLECAMKNCPYILPVPLRIEPAVPVQRRNWTSPGITDRGPHRWALVDLSSVYNAPVSDVLTRVVSAVRPPASPASMIGFDYWVSHMRDRLPEGRMGMTLPVCDAAWRAKVSADGVAWTAEGIPFKTAREGNNIGVVTLAGGFPVQIEVPIHAEGHTLYLMLSGVTWPMQSHVVNLHLVLRYRDGSEEARDLVNPFDIGDCWDTSLGWWHDTPANGFENIGGRFGPAGSNEVADITQPVEVDTEAHILAIPMRCGHILDTLGLEAVANDVVFGIMGATVLRDGPQ
ncbi:MAG: DUF4450 domain-containing protein [Lentisphaerae bacterium]|nr:DUF4450 domain-containing protein [Lentisphaerota bacterium]